MNVVILLAAVFVGLPLVIALAGIVMYNHLVALRARTQNAWSQIDVQLKRRHDLVPNLVETVKGYAAHEKETLERVMHARAAAIQAHGPTAQSKAEGTLGAALGGLLALAEAYPELKANTNFLALQEELTTTENRIGFARQAYNDAAMALNTKIEQFPWNVVASMGGFQKQAFFEIEAPAERAAPQVRF